MAKINQKEYLKKYLMTDEQLKKKKKKSKSHKTVKPTVKIIDADEEDYSFKKSEFHEIDESELFATNQDLPVVVGIIDDRPPELKVQDYRNDKWKTLTETKHSISIKKERRQHSSSESPSESNHSRVRELKQIKRDRTSSSPSPPRRPIKRENSSDVSPPRQRIPVKIEKRSPSSDASPPRRSRKKSPLKTNLGSRKYSSDRSPPRRIKRESSSDISPPRGNRLRQSRDVSPPRRKRKDSSDVSPPRRKRKDSSDASPPRKRRNSPDRNRSHRYSSSPRRNYRRDTSSKSPPRRKKPESPKRIQREGRRSRWSPSPGPSRKRSHSPEPSQKMKKTLDGKSSGLQDAKTLKRENDLFKEKQDRMYRDLNPEVSGRNAEIVIRERSRKGRDFAKEVEEERIKTEKELERKKVYDRWGKGLKQIEDTENRVREMMHEMSKPLARTADDEDLQNHLKDQERIDDPMLQYMRNKKKEADRKKGIEQKPIYQGAFPENRYGIKPGYRWDGVDRSNGYEKKYFDMISAKKAVEEEAYRYATEDM